MDREQRVEALTEELVRSELPDYVLIEMVLTLHSQRAHVSLTAPLPLAVHLWWKIVSVCIKILYAGS